MGVFHRTFTLALASFSPSCPRGLIIMNQEDRLRAYLKPLHPCPQIVKKLCILSLSSLRTHTPGNSEFSISIFVPYQGWSTWVNFGEFDPDSSKKAAVAPASECLFLFYCSRERICTKPPRGEGTVANPTLRELTHQDLWPINRSSYRITSAANDPQIP